MNLSGDGSAWSGQAWGSGDLLMSRLFPVVMSSLDLPTCSKHCSPSHSSYTLQKRKNPIKRTPSVFSLSISSYLFLLIHFPPPSNFKENKIFSEAEFYTCHLFLPPLTLFHHLSLSVWHCKSVFLQQIFNPALKHYLVSLGLREAEKTSLYFASFPSFSYHVSRKQQHHLFLS